MIRVQQLAGRGSLYVSTLEGEVNKAQLTRASELHLRLHEPARKFGINVRPVVRRVLKGWLRAFGGLVGLGATIIGAAVRARWVQKLHSFALYGLRTNSQLTFISDIIKHGSDGRLFEEYRAIPTIGHRLYFRSSVCTAQDFRHPEFKRWRDILAERPRMHRKIWEHVFIAAHLEAAGLLASGKRGIGFGVGQEPLPSAFAARGAEILATDMSATAAASAGWILSQQHAAGLESLNVRGLCPAPTFRRNVAFEVCDMTRIPPKYGDFDFAWSSCSLEHLGSIQAGIDFIKASLATLKVGGLAVHTTEYNVSSNDATIDNNPSLVIYRRRDIERLVRELRADGHCVADVCFDVLSEPVDLFVDLPPFGSDTHIKLALGNFVASSIGIVVERGR